MLAQEINEQLAEGKDLIVKQKGKAGRKLGSLNYKTIQMQDKLRELDCDPVEFLANVMNGRAMREPHPFLEHVISFVNAILNIPSQLLDIEERERFEKLIQQHVKSAHHYLYEGFVPPELQVKVGIELLQYIHAKRKTIEVADDANLIETNARAVADKYDTLFDNAKEAKLVVSDDSVKIEKKE